MVKRLGKETEPNLYPTNQCFLRNKLNRLFPQLAPKKKPKLPKESLLIENITRRREKEVIRTGRQKKRKPSHKVSAQVKQLTGLKIDIKTYTLSMRI